MLNDGGGEVLKFINKDSSGLCVNVSMVTMMDHGGVSFRVVFDKASFFCSFALSNSHHQHHEPHFPSYSYLRIILLHNGRWAAHNCQSSR
jgi:hypothetical protein